MKSTFKITLILVLLAIAAIVLDRINNKNVKNEQFQVIQEETSSNEVIAEQVTEIKRMHPSWDQDGDGINDCENDGTCDHTVDYTQPRAN